MQKLHGDPPPGFEGKALKNRFNIAAFRSPDFRRYFLGNACSLNGLWVQRVTVAWIAWHLTGEATFVGWVAFLAFAPTLISGPVFGVIADRVALIRAATLTQSGLSLIALAMAVLYMAGALTPARLAFLSLAIGVVTSAHHPVRMSLAPLLAPRDAIASVISATALNFNFARSVGPALGGAVIAWAGTGAALWLIFLAYLPYLILLQGLEPRMREGAGPDADQASVLQGLRAGASAAWQDRFIRQTMLTTALFALVGRGMLEILPVIADGIFARGAAGLGLMTSLAGIGALAAAGLTMVLPPAHPGQPPVAGRIAALTGIGLSLMLAVSSSWPVSLAAVTGLGACGALVGVSMQSAIQLVVSDQFRGRVMSLWVMTGIGGASLGALAIGVLSDLIGLAPAGAIIAFAGFAGLVALLMAPAATATPRASTDLPDTPAPGPKPAS